jgi:serine/threonine-protein kinase
LGSRATPNPAPAEPAQRGLSAQHAPKKSAEPSAAKPKRADPGVVIKITDFGIAKILDAQGVTSTGQVLGSPAHMAPEQIEGGDVDARTDVFALGVLMYECLVGHLPFEGKNPAQVLRRVLEGSYAAADRERPEVGGRWARIVAAALARDPAERIASAAQLGERITAELEALGITDPAAEIGAYFADPAAYREQHIAKLVPRLVARGEAARKAGDIPGAAADYNRALALAPNDLTILKRIGSLTSSAGRRQLIRRVSAVVAGSAALGLLAFGVVRTLKARAAVRPPAPVESASATASSAPTPSPDTSASAIPERPHHHPLPSASALDTPVKSIARIAASPGVISPNPPPSGAAPSTRDVRFTIRPSGARLFVDGVEQRSWFGRAIPLSVGGHTVEAVPVDPNCCGKKSTSITVEAPAAGKPAVEMRVGLELDIKPALLTLAASSPAGARAQCPDLGVTLTPGSPMSAKLRDIEVSATCVFTAPDRGMKQGSIKVKAGESKTVTWPE